MDDRVAWAHIQIPAKVFNGDTTDDWFILNGKQGEGKEGMINMVLSHTVCVAIFIIKYPILSHA